MATVIKARLSTLLLAIKQKLIAAAVFDYPEQVLISLRMNPKLMALKSDNYAIILPLSQYVDQSQEFGGGRNTTVINGRVNIYIRNRSATDEIYQSEDWLNHPTRGILDRAHSVIETLSGSFLEDAPATAGTDTAVIANLVALKADLVSELAVVTVAYPSDLALQGSLGLNITATTNAISALRSQLAIPEGNARLIEPMKLVFQGEPHQRYRQANNQWGDVLTEFSIKYNLDLTQTE